MRLQGARLDLEDFKGRVRSIFYPKCYEQEIHTMLGESKKEVLLNEKLKIDLNVTQSCLQGVYCS